MECTQVTAVGNSLGKQYTIIEKGDHTQKVATNEVSGVGHYTWPYPARTKVIPMTRSLVNNQKGATLV